MISPTSNNHRPPSGVTLLELLLVLALLVVIGSLAFPTLHGAFDRQMVRKSAEQIRADLAKARNEAMRSGRIMVFQYEPETGTYRIQPWARQSDLVEGDLQTLATTGSSSTGIQRGATPPSNRAAAAPSLQGGMTAAPGSPTDVRIRSLPDGITFAGANVGQDLRLQASDPNIATVPNQLPPIVFYPDGTSSNAQILLRNRQGHFAIVQLRGLTGMSRLVDRLPDGSLPALDSQPGVPSP